MNMPKVYRFDTFQHVDILQREISYFICLSDHLNISKASEELGIQQSGLSRALQRLESDLGQQLFRRKNNGLVLSPAGEHFLAAIKNTKLAWEENFKKAVADSENPSGLIKIGFHPSFGQKYFPTIVDRVSEAFDQVEIEAHTLSSAAVTRKVNEQELDLGLVISQVHFPELVQKKIGQDFIAAFQRAGSQTPKFILFNPEMQLSNPLIRKHSNAKKIMIKDYDIMAQTCLTTDCLAYLPKSVAERYPSLIQVSGVYIRAEISCISHKEKMKTLSHKKIFDVILSACQKT